MAEDRIVVVGASLAGVRAVEALRDEGYTGSIVLVGAERELPYERPPLSKGALKGEVDYESATLHPQEWYSDNDVDLRLGRPVEELDLPGHRVRVQGQDPLTYDRLLLATGSSVRRLRVPGADAEGVHYLRTRAESQRLREMLQSRPRVVVVGGGWIGLEVAAAARDHGATVSLVEPQPTPLYGVLGPEVGQAFADLHARHGVDLRLGDGVDRVLTHDGRVSGVLTSGGHQLAADLVVVGVGVVPNTGLAEAAGLEVDDGVLCDQSLRSSDPDVFAAGDIASWFNPLLGHRVRVEHWANALDGGQAAGRAMLDQEVVFDAVPFFFSDQYDAGMEYAGHVPRDAETTVVTRGDVSALEFMAFWLDDGRVRAGMHVNVWDTMGDVQDLIRAGRPVDPHRLADTGTPLSEVLG